MPACLDGTVRSFLEDGGGGWRAGSGPRAAWCCNCFHVNDEDGPMRANRDACILLSSYRPQASMVVVTTSSTGASLPLGWQVEVAKEKTTQATALPVNP